MVAYVNGEYVPESEAKISIFDRGLRFGDGVFDTTRTFAGEPFRLEDHLERLCRSLRYIELDGDTIVGEVREAATELVARNRRAIEALGDVWVNMIVTRGSTAKADFVAAQTEPTVIAMIKRINFGAFAPLYERGVDLGVSLMTRHFAGPVDARVKAISRLGYVRADLKMLRGGADAGRWAVIFNDDGSIAEAKGANICLISEGRIVRPPRHEALEGVSLQTLVELGARLGLEAEERRVGVYDVLNADETLITSSSFCVLPVVSFDGIPVRRGEQFGRLLDAWIDLVGMDFVAQARERAAAVERERLAAV